MIRYIIYIKHYDLPNPSNPLKPVMYLDNSNFMHFIPSGHWYPAPGSLEQNESGMAKLLSVTRLLNNFLLEKKKRTITFNKQI